MHPYVKLHKLLRRVPVIIILFIMILCPVDSRNCNGAVRTIQLYSEFTRGLVRIEGKKVIANSSPNYMDQTLQMVTIEQYYFLLYDPNAKMFICWNRRYTDLIAKRNPKNLKYCKFMEKPSIKRPSGMTRYTTTYRKNNTLVEVELRFNKSGLFAVPRWLRKCLENPKKGRNSKDPLRHSLKWNVDSIMNINTLKLNSESKKAYVHLSKYCAEADFILQNLNCGPAQKHFCDQMRRIHQRHSHNMAPELTRFCNL